jgi:hypothetical protein
MTVNGSAMHRADNDIAVPLPTDQAVGDTIPFLKSVITRLLSGLNYPGARDLDMDKTASVLNNMKERGVKWGMTLDKPHMMKTFECALTTSVVRFYQAQMLHVI